MNKAGRFTPLLFLLRRLMPVLSPADWYVTTAASGLYVVEKQDVHGWQPEGVFLSLRDAFAYGELLHGPVSGVAAACAALIARHEQAPARVGLPALVAQPERQSTMPAGQPFHLRVTPAGAVPHAGWQQARTASLAALGRGQAVALLGQPGTGKTLLLRDLAQALGQEGRSVRVVERGDALDLTQRADVLLIDEADCMSPDLLAALCAGDVGFVLAALPGFAQRLTVLPRHVAQVALQPLSPEDVARFVAARLSAAECPRDLFEPGAVLTLARHSAGLLRVVNALAGAAMALAELEQAPHVRQRHVEDAVSMRDGLDEDAAPVLHPVAEQGASEVISAAAFAVASPPYAPRRWQVRGALVAAAGLGAVLLGNWAASGWDAAPPPAVQVAGSARLLPAMARQDTGPVPAAVRTQAGSEAGADQPDGSTPHQGTQMASRPRPGPAGTSIAFQGPVNNETMRQSGRLSLVIARRDASGAITARFHASDGLVGSGELTGSVSGDGHIAASGQLMMGKNPFLCDLSGTLIGDNLVGSARFVRTGSGRVAHSSFNLTKL